MGNALSLAVSIGVPLVGGMVGGFVTQKDVLTWYPKIKKPKWTPPNFLFAPVWSALYVMMGTASWLVWRKKGNHRVALSLYGVQLLLNLIWNPLFFKTHKTDVALVDISALLGFATAATVAMSRAHTPAAQLPLMVPYLVWVSYATALNANIWANNPSERLIKSRRQKAAEAAAVLQPSTAVAEAARAATSGVQAVKAAGQAVSAGSAAVQHATAAAQPVLAAADAVKHTAEGVKHAVQETGATLGVSPPSAPPPPSASAGASPATMAPASKAIAKEVERAAVRGAKEAMHGGKQEAAAAAAAAAAAGETRGAAAAMEKELKQAGAI